MNTGTKLTGDPMNEHTFVSSLQRMYYLIYGKVE
jgi:hypothetical protein